MSRTSSYAFVDCILDKLTTLPVTTHFHTIHEELATLRSSLGKVVDLRDENVKIQSLWDRLLEVAYKVESLIDHFMINGALPDPSSPPFDSIFQDMSNMKIDVLKIQAKKVVPRPMQSQASPSPSNEIVVGFNKEKVSILDKLHRGSKRLQIVFIVGMPGLGKTTLATRVFTHPSNMKHFSARAWCTISQVLDKKKVLLDLLKQINPEKASGIVRDKEHTEHDVANKLRQSLKGVKYLIFLDDIWNAQAWDDLKDSFPDDERGSRIIFTSRSSDAAPCDMLVALNPLSEEESLELFQKKIFPEKGDGWPLELHDLGMQMVEKCKGLPLSIIVLAGVCATIKPGHWKKFLESVGFFSTTESCRYTLELSYKHLPDHLKPCLVYFGVYPEDQEIQVRRLLRLWIAEGFIRKSETRSIDDVAEGYLKTLIDRSLIMASKQRCDGGFKTCRIHDLLRDFCLQKAKDEHFFHSVKGYDELSSFRDPRNLRRLCFNSIPEHLKRSELICPHVRSLHFNNPRQYGGTRHMLQFYKLLNVLDLEQISFCGTFPDEIGQLLLLTFLAIRGDITYIPSWLGNLPNLETLIFIQETYSLVTLPISICNMKKLRYLYLRGQYACFSICEEDVEKSTLMYELDRLSCVSIPKASAESVLRMFPNLRKLKCRVFEDSYDGEVHPFPTFSRKLESLNISSPYEHFMPFDFTSLVNLKKLTLANFELESRMFSTMSHQLPNLEILKLGNLGFITREDTWELKEGEFSKLRILHISEMRIRKWIASDEFQFESLQKLVLRDNWILEELPCCLGSTETLELIELSECGKSLVDIAQMIEEIQHNEWGNMDMKTLQIRGQISKIKLGVDF